MCFLSMSMCLVMFVFVPTADDMAESFMMSFWLNGILRTQKACYVVDDGDLRFCRPLAFVREQDTKQFGKGFVDHTQTHTFAFRANDLTFTAQPSRRSCL